VEQDRSDRFFARQEWHRMGQIRAGNTDLTELREDGGMSAEDLENYETDMELQLYREYRDVAGLFSYVVETERRFYLANHVDLQARSADGEIYFDLTLQDAWVWDIYRSARFVKKVRVLTFKDVNIEELTKTDDLTLPKDADLGN
jgi:hypothetical protein